MAAARELPKSIFNLCLYIAGRREVARALVGSEAVQQPSDFSPERVHGARGGFAEQRFAFGEQFFDGIEIGGLRRQIADVCLHCFNSLFDARHFVTAYSIGDDDVARVPRRAEEFLDILQKQGAGHGAIRHHRSRDVIMPQSGDERGGMPVAVRHGADAPFAAWGASVAPSPVRRRPGFIQKNQFRDIQSGLSCLPLTPRGLHVGALLLAGVQGFF